ncbi:hypothetical protein Xedl_03528 [Xenorhabdus eapokensis]|uniref:Uncharacterized protein n=1 Tax=Xenorhabdus eapokensis TaxID=1873482 RepID=A0A1Q5THN8_9GAMM|nr:hypothetical protein Xedl_03528 [Xenorhabdus eapokensis]
MLCPSVMTDIAVRLSRYPLSSQGDIYVSEKAHRKTSARKGTVWAGETSHPDGSAGNRDTRWARTRVGKESRQRSQRRHQSPANAE